ncbi:MAG: glycosyltransferase [Myxococcota bacterium]
MKIALHHGYELTGSGSNEYTRYLAQALAALGHEVAIMCCEPKPEAFEFIARASAYDAQGQRTELFDNGPGAISLHRLPRTSVYPVYLTDKQRDGVVKAFVDMTDDELAEYHQAMAAALHAALDHERPDIVHCNHLVYQPIVAAEVCARLSLPFYVVPHGSSIEYTIHRDERFVRLARRGLVAASGVAWIAREVRERVHKLASTTLAGAEQESEAAEPVDLSADLLRKEQLIGVGTDTSLFQVIAPEQRAEALAELARLHRPGGKTPEQRQALCDAVQSGDMSAVQAYWDAYNHKLEDTDLPQLTEVLTEAREIVFFVGALTFGKGVQSLLCAMPALLQKRPDAHLVIVGSGTYREVLEALLFSLTTHNLELFDRLVTAGRDLERDVASGPLEDLHHYAADPDNRALLQAHGPALAGRVHFVGRLDHRRLRHLFPCATVAAFPSIIKEASPLVFAEALACGVLPTGAYHSGLRDGLDDLQQRIDPALWPHMCLPAEPERRVQGIVDSLSTLLDMLAQKPRAAELRVIAEQHYDWSAKAKLLAAFAQRIVSAC